MIIVTSIVVVGLAGGVILVGWRTKAIGPGVFILLGLGAGLLALGLTFGLAVNTREAVARETPASLATSSRVGFDPFCGSALTRSLYTVSALLSTIARERSRGRSGRTVKPVPVM